MNLMNCEIASKATGKRTTCNWCATELMSDNSKNANDIMHDHEGQQLNVAILPKILISESHVQLNGKIMARPNKIASIGIA
jgi:hypothetical protein